MARSSLITTGAMTSRLDRLERARLIRRTPDPDDRPGVRIRLTPRGSKVAGQALQELIAANEAFLAPLSGPPRDSIDAALKQLLVHHETRSKPPSAAEQAVEAVEDEVERERELGVVVARYKGTGVGDREGHLDGVRMGGAELAGEFGRRLGIEIRGIVEQRLREPEHPAAEDVQ